MVFKFENKQIFKYFFFTLNIILEIIIFLKVLNFDLKIMLAKFKECQFATKTFVILNIKQSALYLDICYILNNLFLIRHI